MSINFMQQVALLLSFIEVELVMGFSYSMNINQLAKIKIMSKGICIINTAISEAYTP